MMLKPVRESIGRDMRWYRRRMLPAAYELRTSEEQLATLEWAGVFTSTAEAATAEGTWRFRRAGPLAWRLWIVDAATGTELGCYTPAPFRGRLQLADGSEFRVGRDRPLGRFGVWREDGGLLMSFARRPVPGGGSVHMEAAASAEPRIALLVTFAFYLLTIRRRRAARSGG